MTEHLCAKVSDVLSLVLSIWMVSIYCIKTLSNWIHPSFKIPKWQRKFYCVLMQILQLV